MKIIIPLIFLILSSVATATDYYVKNGGNDSANGTSDATAWATIGKVNSIFSSLKAGDRILFRRGDTFYGSIKITRSGVAGSPITLGAYGTGDKPVITGFSSLTSWTSEGNGIYSAPVVSESLTNMVIIDGKQYAMGRWPDEGYNIFESAVSNLSITDNELSAATDWTGAEVVIRKNDWSLDRCKITDHTGTKLTYTSLSTTQDAIAGHGYFIQNDRRTLSRYGEWFHDHNSGKLYVYFGSDSPSGKTVRIATLNNVVYTSEYDYITLDNLHLSGSIDNLVTCLNYISNYWTIKNSVIDFAGQDGIHIMGHYATIDNNLVSNCNQLGISAVGNYETITSNKISNIGLVPGQAHNGIYTSGVFITNDNCLIKYNTIENIGYCGIHTSSTTDIITIQNNFFNNITLTLNDGAAIYLVAEGTSRKVDGNIIMNVIGNTAGTPYPDRHIARGIYLDVGTTKATITNNTVAYCTEAGYMIHRSHDNTFENNTAFNNGYGMFLQNASVSTIRNNVLNNNIFLAKASSQLSLRFYSGTDDIPSFGTADNNYYARPVADDNVFFTYSPSTGSKYRTLSGWQTFTGQDQNSKKSPVSVSDTSKIDFYYNPTTSNRAISLSQPMIDVKGTKYSGSITLAPYRSVILMPDPNPDTPAIPVFSGAVIEDGSPLVVVLTYSINLANIVPTISAFNVKVNGTSRTINSVSVSGNKVSLTLANPAVYGDVVTVSYTCPETNPLQTSESGLAASISNQTVDNNCTAPAQTQPEVNNPPVVSIYSPIKGTTFTSPATVVIDVEARDQDGSIKSVALFNGIIRLEERSAPPYSFTLKNLEEGTYSLHAVATDNLNSATTSANLEFHVVSPTEEKRDYFNLYPNPNDGHFSIDFTTLTEADIFIVTVYNIIGRTVYRTELSKEESTKQFDLSHLDSGIYVVMVSANEILLTQKFIKS